jgi:hypothetical protein
MLMLLIVGVSLGGAYLLFFSTQGGSGWGTTNNGTFLSPPRTAAELGLGIDSGEEIDEKADLSGSWWLWVVAPLGCDAQCEDALFQLRQLHVLLNKDATRVRRALVLSGVMFEATSDVAIDSAHSSRYPDLTTLHGSLHGLASGVYIVDPIGNLVFWYPLTDAGKPVLDDLKHLLKVSQIG